LADNNSSREEEYVRETTTKFIMENKELFDKLAMDSG